MVHTVKGFGIVNKAEVDVFLELAWFFYDPTNVGNLISGSMQWYLKICPQIRLGIRKLILLLRKVYYGYSLFGTRTKLVFSSPVVINHAVFPFPCQSVQFSCSVVSYSLRPHGLQPIRLLLGTKCIAKRETSKDQYCDSEVE